MKGRVLLYRYLPLAAVVVIQVLIIAIAPSKSPAELSGFGPQTGASDPTVADRDVLADPFGDDLDDIDPETGERTAGGTNGSGSTGTGTGGGGGTGDDERPPGDTSHCVDGRQYDPKIYAYAPRCTPKFGGNNGGATYRGVEAEEIRVVIYRDNLGEAVDRLLQAQGGNASDQQWRDMIAAAEEFVNSRYELYGRNVKLIFWKGECQSVPPDYPCLRGEMRRIVQQHEPFWVVRNTSLASPAFDELSNLKVMNSGGWGFRDVFRQQRRPYSWDLMMGGTQQVEMVAEWYCGRMHGGKAIHAGDQNPDEDLRDRDRVLGVISTDDPENKLAITEFKRHLEACGAEVTHEYYYSQDITTAEQQRRAGVETMRREPMATTIMCFCDLVAPIFLYQTCEEYEYYPEHVMVGTGLMDHDSAAQAYDNTLPPFGTQFHNAFGLAQRPYQEPENATMAHRVWADTGRSGGPHPSLDFTIWDHVGMVAFMLQSAGPNLNPQTVEQGAFRAGAIAPGNNQNQDFNQRSFSPGDYTWQDTLREIYWSTEQTSRRNGEQGTYVSLNNGRWYEKGQFPSGRFQLPPKPR